MNAELVKVAAGEYGVNEIPGDKSNPDINKYFDIIGHTWADDEVAWCSAFVNWVAKSTNHEYSGELTARSWLSKGHKVEQPEPGDLVIYWRESPASWKGHVGFFFNRVDSHIWTLGGNQDNMVKVTPYPDYRLLGFRRLEKRTENM